MVVVLAMLVVVCLVLLQLMVAVRGLIFLVLILSQVPVMEQAVLGLMVVTHLEVQTIPNRDLDLLSSLIPLEQHLIQTSISLAVVPQLMELLQTMVLGPTSINNRKRRFSG